MYLQAMDLESAVFRLARKLLEMKFQKALDRRRALDPEFKYAGEAWEYRLGCDLHVYHWTELESHNETNAWHAWDVAPALSGSDGSLWVPAFLVQDVCLDL